MTIDKFGRTATEREKIPLRGPPGEGFNLTESGDYDLRKKRVVNIAQPIDNFDAVSKQYVDSETKRIKMECVQSINDLKLDIRGIPSSIYNSHNFKSLSVQISSLKNEITKLEQFCRAVDVFAHKQKLSELKQ